MSLSKKIFPIEATTACLLKWTWSNIYFDTGTSASCHRTQKYPIDPDNFDEFHNLPEKIKAREMMLQGEWPQAGCQYCQLVEERGGVSDRLVNLDHYDNSYLAPPELLKNKTETHVTPKIIEVWFANTCNMSCVYCGPQFSSLWQDEIRRFGPIKTNAYKINVTTNQQYDKMVSDFWNYLDTNERYKELRRYHILGGEPFLLKELSDSIDFWNEHPNPDLTFGIISNLNVPHERFVKYIDKFEQLCLDHKIWRLQLTASLDGWGPEQEYVRHGLDLNLWQQNFEYILNKPWIVPSINSTINSLSMKELPALIEKINYWNTKQTFETDEYDSKKIVYSFNTSNGCESIYTFGDGLFDKEFSRVLELMPADNSTQIAQKEAMRGIAVAAAKSVNKIEKISELKDFLSELDRRRGTDWRSMFTWLDRDFTN